ncbi:MAG: ACGX-repeat peptide [Bacteroidales bacterium]|nr:ACGX-repeat peptide [Bacteroidales bacterium]
MVRTSDYGIYFSKRSAQSYLCAPIASETPSAACGSACGAGDAEVKPEPKPAACGSACGAGDAEVKPEPKPAACGSACGAGDK